jgi:Domain of unknown function (DUF4168)
MQLFKRRLATAIFTAGCYLSVPAVNVPAQSSPPGPTTSAPDLSDQKLTAVAAAMKRIVGLQKDYQQRIAEAPKRIVAEANDEFIKAVTEQGLSVEEYASILEAARENPEIQDKIRQRIQPSDEQPR